MNLIDILQIYSYHYDTDDMFYMLKDYPLDERLNRDELNKMIINRLGAMRPVTTYSEIFKFKLDTFFEQYKDNISKLVDTLEYDYNPLENKNITETEHRDSIGDIDNTDKYTTNKDQTETGNSVEERKVSAFDSSSYENKELNTTTPNLRTDNDVTHSGETTSDIKSEVDTIKHITGKDGDASIQSLINEERKLTEFNIYDWIIKKMKPILFLLVY